MVTLYCFNSKRLVLPKLKNFKFKFIILTYINLFKLYGYALKKIIYLEKIKWEKNIKTNCCLQIL